MHALGTGLFPQSKVQISSHNNTVLGLGLFEELGTQSASFGGNQSAGFHRYCGASEREMGVSQVETPPVLWFSPRFSRFFFPIHPPQIMARFVNIQHSEKVDLEIYASVVFMLDQTYRGPHFTILAVSHPDQSLCKIFPQFGLVCCFS